uniref:AT hook-like n=1 Tax=Steinernema glaseri TaxID=37863 RepID=A0A1I7Y836_9BILA
MSSKSPPLEINPKTGKPKRPRKPRAPRATTRKKSAPEPTTIIPDDIVMPPPYPRNVPTMKPPWETGVPFPSGRRDLMLKASSGVPMMESPPNRTMKSPVPVDSCASSRTAELRSLWLQTSNTPTMLPPPGAPSNPTNSSMLARLLAPPTTPPFEESLGSEGSADGTTPAKGRRQTAGQRKRTPRR